MQAISSAASRSWCTAKAMVRARQWTGFEAAALQEAMRKSIREFAALLGVETTTITNWRSGLSAVTPRSGTQAILDTTYQQRRRPRTATDVVAMATRPIDHAPARVGMDHANRVRDWAAFFRAADDAGLRRCANRPPDDNRTSPT
ncbi:hypothetical protein [Nocardia sputorum]|uniref:hypothetical protein n=1 Tax=Nocardia sputorum TaxID=2984338 RepID=UPI002490B183|nr:hypothetical protein [Nocardia sputorum]